ncbi:MAG: GNAT family N-acetyltransferase [Acidobacteria bacterium]|nr:GNAT family N-acetyltransferase [Acidobacteriota bacterium]
MQHLEPDDIFTHADALCRLLWDAVDSGASVGFLPPVDPVTALDYWNSVRIAMHEESRLLLAAFDDVELIAAVQLDLATQANALHRAEVCKLLVRRDVRRRGIGRALMLAAEDAARSIGRTLLVLDTRKGDPSEGLYRSMGYTLAGEIPGYARSADGTLHSTVILYKTLAG